jgi:type I restriction enzyme S subunit
MTEKKTRSREGWTRVRFGDVVRLATERCANPLAAGIERYVGLEHLEPSDLRIRSWGNVVDGVTFTNRFHPGQVLFGKRRAYQRKVAVPDFAGVCSGDIYVFEPADDQLLPDLLPFVCQSEGFFEHALKTSAGSLSPRTNWKSLQAYEFDLPPVEEQERRCRLLRASQTAIESWHTAATVGDLLRDSLIKQLFSHGTTSERRIQTPIGEVPASWTVAPLESRYHIQLGKMVSPKVNPAATPCAYLRNENVQWNRLDLSDVKEMGFTDRERLKFVLRSGDVLACEGRHVGKAALWRDEIPGACYQKALHRLRARSAVDIPEYILHCFRYFSITRRFLVDTAETTIPHLALERLKPMLFPFAPTEEQRRIVARIASLDDAIAAARQSHSGSIALNKAVMEAA